MGKLARRIWWRFRYYKRARELVTVETRLNRECLGLVPYFIENKKEKPVTYPENVFRLFFFLNTH